MDAPFSEEETLVSCVLVVDDEPSVRDVFARLLARESDLTVVTAESAEAALYLLGSQRFDLLITDKNLPGMGGIELVAEARKLRPHIEAIMITGYASAESVIAAFAAGASDYVVKPFEQIGVVRAKVHAALDRRKERIKGSEESTRVAREAALLLSKGKTVSDPSWHKLEQQLAAYELAIRAGAWGTVLVVGNEGAAAKLKSDGVEAGVAEPGDLRLDVADVVVIDTGVKEWRELVDRLQKGKPDLLLVAGKSHELGDLLEAISLKLDLVGLEAPGLLAERVRGLLMRQAVQSAKQGLAQALMEFRTALMKSA